METQDILVAVAAFILAAGLGFAAHQSLKGDDKFSTDVSLRVDTDNQIASTEFDGNFLELRYEDTDRAKYYFKFNDSRRVQQIENLKQDGTLQTTTKIRSFGNKTYFLHLRYQDDPSVSDDGFMEIYRVEET